MPRRQHGLARRSPAEKTADTRPTSRRNARRAVGLAEMLVVSWALAGCSHSPSPTKTPDLLSVRVASSQQQDVSEFNQTTARAAAAGESWPQDPILVVRRFAKWGSEQSGIWMMDGAGVRPSRYQIVAIADGLPDDSVRGKRLDVSLERSRESLWLITDAKLSWRCWPERGHESFSSEPCR